MKKLKNPRGVAMVWAIMVVMVLMFLILILTTLFEGNLKTTVHQENQIRAYYYCRSGLDLGTEALIREQTGLGGPLTLLEKLDGDPVGTTYTDVLSLDEGKGQATVTAKTVMRNGQKWVEVLSVGQFTYQGKPVTYSGKLYILTSDSRVIEHAYVAPGGA